MLVGVPVFFLSGKSFVIPIIVALVGSFLLILIMIRLAPGAVLRSFGSIPANEKQFPRLHNALEGICVNHGLDKPDVYVIDNPRGNAAAVADKRSQAVVLTTGAIDSLNLIEIEGLSVVFFVFSKLFDSSPFTNWGYVAAAITLALVGAYHLQAGWRLDIDETGALVEAAKTAGFPVGHASAQMVWRGIRSRPVWRVLLYSSESPPIERG